MRFLSLLVAILLSGASAVHAQQTAPLVPLGRYTQMHQDGEHCRGFEVDLWRSGTTVYGSLRTCTGLTGDRASGVLEDVHYNATSGALSFTARLSQGSDYLGGGRQVPSQDVYSFRGKLSAQLVTGQMTYIDRVYNKGPAASAVRLRRDKTALPTFKSEEEWRSQAK